MIESRFVSYYLLPQNLSQVVPAVAVYFPESFIKGGKFVSTVGFFFFKFD